MQADVERLNRLRWRCRRGLLELDLWLERFVQGELNRFSAEEFPLLESLLEEADADILDWLEGRQAVPERHGKIIERVRLSV